MIISNYLNSLKAQLCLNCRQKMDKSTAFPRNDISSDRMLLGPGPGVSEGPSLGSFPSSGYNINMDMAKNFIPDPLRKKPEEVSPFFFQFSPRREIEDGHSLADTPLRRKNSDNTLFNRQELSDYSMLGPMGNDDLESKNEFK